MKSFFTDIDQVRQFITVDVSSDLDTVKPYFIEAHKFVRRVVDSFSFDVLLDYANGDSADEQMDELLSHIRRINANFGYMMAADKLMLSVGESGIMRMSNSSGEPASSEDIEAFKKSCASSGYNAIEELMRFVDDNSDTYSEIHQFLFDIALFVNNSIKINELIGTELAYRDFMQLKPQIHIAEVMIRHALGNERFEDLKTDSPTPENLLLLPAIERYEAHFAYGMYYKKTEHEMAASNEYELLVKKVAEMNGSVLPSFENTEENRVVGF